jgi:hypothetical protein
MSIKKLVDALLEVKADGDRITAGMPEVQKRWQAAAANLIPVLDKTKTYASYGLNGELCLLFFKDNLLMVSEAVWVDDLTEIVPLVTTEQPEKSAV